MGIGTNEFRALLDSLVGAVLLQLCKMLNDPLVSTFHHRRLV